MIVCDVNGIVIVYDMWVHLAGYHEVRPVRIRYQKSLWFRALADSFCLMGDRRYRGLEYVYVCEERFLDGVSRCEEYYDFTCLPSRLYCWV